MKNSLRLASALTSLSLIVSVAGPTGMATAGTDAVLVASHFTDGVEGWRVRGDSQSAHPHHRASGGIPGGYIRTTDTATGGVMYWQAPAKFLGDKHRAYKGKLSFALRQDSTSSQFDADDVILSGNGFTLTYDTFANPGTIWTTYVIPLVGPGWMNGDRPATKSDMRSVLNDLASLEIRAEFVDGPDTDDLDEVVITGRS